MKSTLFFCSVLALAASKPGGYYHQEYNYKSSSSSFKNNELQHQNEDQGFYSKDGDLDGQLKPKVNSHNQHSEYTNPKLLGGSSSYQGVGGFSGGSSNYLASSDRLFGSNMNGFQSGGAVDGYASTDRVIDLGNVYASGSHGSSQGAYGLSHGNYGTSQGGYGGSLGGYGGSLGGYRATQGYSVNQVGYGSTPGDYRIPLSGNYVGTFEGGSSLGHSQQRGSSYGYVQHGSSYGTSGTYGKNANLNSIAQRLQDDLSRQLESAIHNQYRSSGYTTSVSSSQMSADVRALEDELKRNLTRQLKESLQSQFGQQEIRGTNSYTMLDGRPTTTVNYNNQELADLTQRLEDNLIKKLHQDMHTTYNRESSSSYTSNSNMYQPTYTSSSTYRPNSNRPVIIFPSNTRYTPISNPESITTIASRTQSNINSYLDSALHNVYEKYLQSDRTAYYTLGDFDIETDRIKQDIIRNLTQILDDEVRRNYGQQVLKGDYYYSVSASGEVSTEHNYNMKDYDNLRKQVEENLLRKLNQTVNTYRSQYQRQQLSYNTNANSYTVTHRPANSYTITYRPIYYTTGSQTYDYSDLQRQLSQQLQNALNKQSYSSYSTSTAYNPQAYQKSLDELSRELQRNLTEQLSNYKAQASSGSSSSYGYISGSGGGSRDFESMKNQLQRQLMQQLEQGLQKQYHYSASASYSASSSSSSNSNYGTHQAYGNYGNNLECCGQGDDPTTYRGRNKRDISYNAYGSSESGHRSYKSHKFSRRSSNNFSQKKWSGVKNYRAHHDTFVEVPATRHPSRSSLNVPYNQQLSDIDNSERFGGNKLEKYEKLGFSDQTSTGQKLEDDMAQQLELSSGHSMYSHHQITEKHELTSPKVSVHSQYTGQELGDHLTQKLENQHQKSHYTEDQQLTQQLEDDFTQQLELGNNQKPHSSHNNEDQQLLEQQLRDVLTQKPKYSKHNEYSQLVEQQVHNDLTQTPKNSKYNEDQQLVEQQLQDDLTQKPKSSQDNEDQQLLEQQLQDDLTQKPKNLKYNEDQQLVEQESQDELTQKLELENGHHTKLFAASHLEDQTDVDQQLELVPEPKYVHQLEKTRQVAEDLETQQLQLNQPHKVEKLDQQLLGQQLEDQDELAQQLEITNSHKPKNSKPKYNQEFRGQQEQELEQKLVLSATQKLLQHESMGQSYQDQDDLTQQLEDVPKPKYTQQLKGQELEGNSEQQLELSNGEEPKVENQHSLDQKLQEQEDFTQQLELADEKNQKHKKSHKIYEDQFGEAQHLETSSSLKPKIVDQQILEQQQDDLSQQLELTSINKSGKKKPEHTQDQRQGQKTSDERYVQELENQTDLTQQLEDVPKAQYTQQLEGQQEDDLTQQLEDVPKAQYTQQLEGQQDDLTQQLEDVPKAQYTQQLEGQEEDDLTQQLEMTDAKKPKPSEQRLVTGQQLEDQNDLDQQLVLAEGEVKNKHRINQKQELEGQMEDDITQQLVLSNNNKNNQQLELTEDYNRKHEKPKRKFESQQSHDFTQQLETSNTQTLRTTEQQIQEQQSEINHFNKPNKQNQELETQFKDDLTQQQLELIHTKDINQIDQQLQEQEQNLESTFNRKHKSVQEQQLEGQQLEDDFTQQLELTHTQKLKQKILEQVPQKLENNSDQKLEQIESKKTKYPEQEGQQLEHDFSKLELSGSKNPKPKHQQPIDFPKAEAELLETSNLQATQRNPYQQPEDDLQQQLELTNDRTKPETIDQEQITGKLPKNDIELSLTHGHSSLRPLGELENNHHHQSQFAFSDHKVIKHTHVSEIGHHPSHTTENLGEPGSYHNSYHTQAFGSNHHEIQDLLPQTELTNMQGQNKNLYQFPEEYLQQNLELTGDHTKNFDQQHVGHQTHYSGYQGYHLKPFESSDRNYGHQTQFSSSGNKILTHTQISQTRNHPTHTIEVSGHPGAQHRNHFTNFETGTRPFTNGHSDGPYTSHSTISGLGKYGEANTGNSYEEALRQQDALMDLLKQKIQAQVTYGQKTIKNTVYVNGKPVSSSEKTQLIEPNGEIIESSSNSNSLLKTNSLSQNGQMGHYGHIPHSQDLTSKTSYVGNNFRGSTHRTEETRINPTGDRRWSPFRQETLGDSTLAGFSSNHFEHQDFQRNTIQNPEFTGKTTKRIIHYVNGKPVTASENVLLRKANGEVIESKHDLPLDDNLLRQNSYFGSFSSNPFAQSLGNHHHLDASSYGIGTSEFRANTRKTTAKFVNGKLVSSASEVIGPDGEVLESKNGSPVDINSIEKQIIAQLENSGAKVSKHKYDVKTQKYSENGGYL